MTNPTVLVTGGAGYIGSHVCKALATQGFTPVAYDNLCSGNAEAVKWGPFEQGDIRDAARLDEVMAKYKPVATMHFAALIQVGGSVPYPAKYYDNNVYGSYMLLEAGRRHGIKNMVFSSTAAVYGIPEYTPIPESHTLKPINPYGQTKLVMEGMIRDYAQAYGFNYTIFRYFNAAGAHPDGDLGGAFKVESHVVPLMMRVASGHRPAFSVFGTDYPTADGTAVRDYVHVVDLADAHVRALKHLLKGGESLTLNLGTNNGNSVREMVELARKVTGTPVPVAEAERRAGDPPALVADAAKARAVLGWTPVNSSLENILSTAWAWRQKQNNLGRVGALTGIATFDESEKRSAA